MKGPHGLERNTVITTKFHAGISLRYATFTNQPDTNYSVLRKQRQQVENVVMACRKKWSSSTSLP